MSSNIPIAKVAPPLDSKKSSTFKAWVIVAIGALVMSLMICLVAGGIGYSIGKRNSIQSSEDVRTPNPKAIFLASSQQIVGKWGHAENLWLGMAVTGLADQPAFEFFGDGTGKRWQPDLSKVRHVFLPNEVTVGKANEKEMEKMFPTPSHFDIRWKIEPGSQAPILVMAEGKHWPEAGMDVKTARFFFERDGDLLTLSSGGNALKLKKTK